MDFIKSQFDRISQQLAGLTPSQKMLSASLVVIMVMTLFWWGRFAGTPESVAILDQALSPEEISSIKMLLDSRGVEAEVKGDRILVSSSKKHEALAIITMADKLPTNIVSGFDEAIKQLTAWDGQDRQNAIFNNGKQRELQRVISHFPGVASATVLIDPASKLRIGRPVDPTASVHVSTKGEGAANLKQLASACAFLVSRSQAGMKPEHVAVIINNQAMPPVTTNNPADGMAASDMFQALQNVEKHETEKLQEYLNPTIPGVRVLVTCQVNATSRSMQKSEVNKEKSGIFEEELMTKTREDSTSRSTAGEPAVVTNTGLAIGSGGASPASPMNSSSESQETLRNKVIPAIMNITESTQAGQHAIASVAVRVPLSYFVGVFKGRNSAAPEPTDADLDKVIARELPKIQRIVATSTRLTQPDMIAVDTFSDFTTTPVNDTKIAASTGVGTMLSGHVKEIALGGLALASLFMMSMIVRKGAVTPIPAAAVTPRKSQSNLISVGEAFAGEVSEQNPALDGMELDDDSIRTQQMLSQVSSMVGESPETAAQLIKRWMNQR